MNVNWWKFGIGAIMLMPIAVVIILADQDWATRIKGIALLIGGVSYIAASVAQP